MGQPNSNIPPRDWQNWALTAYIALIILTVLWEGWLAPAPRVPPGFWLTIKSLPLLFPLFGLLHGKLYTFRWSSLLIIIYFMEGVVLVANHWRDPFKLHGILPYALLEVLLTLLFFWCSLLYIRQHRVITPNSAPRE